MEAVPEQSGDVGALTIEGEPVPKGIIEDVMDAVSIENDDARIDFIFEKIADRFEELKTNEAAREARLAMVNDHFDAEAHRLGKEIEWLRADLTGRARSYSYPKGKKSKKFPYGTLGSRTKKMTLELVDKELALRAAINGKLEDVIDRSPSLKWGELKKRFLSMLTTDDDGTLKLANEAGEMMDAKVGLDAFGVRVVAERTEYFAKSVAE